VCRFDCRTYAHQVRHWRNPVIRLRDARIDRPLVPGCPPVVCQETYYSCNRTSTRAIDTSAPDPRQVCPLVDRLVSYWVPSRIALARPGMRSISSPRGRAPYSLRCIRAVGAPPKLLQVPVALVVCQDLWIEFLVGRCPGRTLLEFWRRSQIGVRTITVGSTGLALDFVVCSPAARNGSLLRDIVSRDSHRFGLIGHRGFPGRLFDLGYGNSSYVAWRSLLPPLIILLRKFHPAELRAADHFWLADKPSGSRGHFPVRYQASIPTDDRDR